MIGTRLFFFGLPALLLLGADAVTPTVPAADRKGGRPLPTKQGPLRIVCATDKKPARSVRMLEAIEIVRLQK
jgi:hypothetical protein